MIPRPSGGHSTTHLVLILVALSSIKTAGLVESRQEASRRVLDGQELSVSGKVLSARAGEDAILDVHGKRFRIRAIPPFVQQDSAVRLVSGIHPGDRLLADGTFRAPGKRRNPYDFDERRFYTSRRWLGDLEDLKWIVVDHTSHDGEYRFQIQRVKKWARERLRSRFSAEVSPLLSALFLGDRQALPESVVESFRRSGLSHILAVSGLHVGLIAGMIHFLIRFMMLRIPVRKPLRKYITIILNAVSIGCYALLVGMTASVFRASIMVLVVVVGSLFHRKPVGFRALGTAFFIVLLCRPEDIRSVGFQLSFMAVACILVGVQRSRHGLLQHHLGIGKSWWAPFTSAVAVSLFAALGTAPLLGYYFGFVPLTALVFSPMVVGLLMVGMPVAAISILLPFHSLSLVAVTEMVFSAVLRLASVGADSELIPNISGPLNQFAPIPMVGLGVFLIWTYRNRRIPRTLFLFTWACCIVLATIRAKPLFRITFLDVGQGDAAVMESPEKGALVVDAGPRSTSGVILGRHLRGRDLMRSYQLLVTHAHTDHTGGVSRFLIDADKTTQLPANIFHGGWLSRQSPTVETVRRGDLINLGEGARAYVLNPPAPGGQNEDSVVLLFRYGKTSVLMMGDAGETTEKKLVRQFKPLLQASIIKVGHHGSRSSSSSEFIEAVRPELAVISAGRSNSFGHPHAEVLARFQRSGISTVRTASHGAVEVLLDGASARWQTQINDP